MQTMLASGNSKLNPLNSKLSVLPQYVAGKQDARAPISRGTHVFHHNTAGAGAVYADDAARCVFHHHSHMLDTTAPAVFEKQQIARHHFLEGNFGALQRLGAGTAGYRSIKFLQNKTCKTRAIETRFRASAGIAVAGTDKILREINDLGAQLQHLQTHGSTGAKGAPEGQDQNGKGDKYETAQFWEATTGRVAHTIETAFFTGQAPMVF